MDELTAADLPIEPPEGLEEWAVRTQLQNIHGLVYRTGWYADPLSNEKERCVDVRCSACGRMAKVEMVPTGCFRSYASAPFGYKDANDVDTIHGNATLCPICGAQAQAVYAGRVDEPYVIGRTRPMTVQAVDGRLVLLFWDVRRSVDLVAKESTVVTPRYAFVVEKKRIRCFSFRTSWAPCYQYKDTAGQTEVVYPWEKSELYGTTAENSKLDIYLNQKGNRYPVSYMRLWVDHPRVENLLVQGAGHLVQELIQRDCKPAGGSWNGEVNIPKLKDVAWREKRPAQMLGLTKDVFRILVKQRWTIAEWETFKAIQARGEILRAEADMEDIRRLGGKAVNTLLKNNYPYPIMRSVRYLLKQKHCDAAILNDYWNLVVQNGGTLADASVRYPQNLQSSHDHEAWQQRFLKDASYEEEIEKRAEALSALSYEADGLMIRPVATAEELFCEGSALRHCVYSYLSRHVSGKTAIFLIRKVDQPDIPYFTLEYDEDLGAVRQNRGRCNCSRTPDVEAFEEKWMSFVKAKIGKERKVA